MINCIWDYFDNSILLLIKNQYSIKVVIVKISHKHAKIIRDFSITIILLMCTSIIAFFITKFDNANDSIPVTFVLAVVSISVITAGYSFGVIASLIAVFIVNYFFTYPYLTIDFTVSGFPITFFSMLIVSVVTCALAARGKDQALRAETKENEANILFHITRQLLIVREIDEIVKLASNFLTELYNCTVIISLDEPTIETNPDSSQASYPLNEKIAANWCYNNMAVCGCGTDVPMDAKGMYIPLLSSGQILGVIGLYDAKGMHLNNDNIQIVNIICSQISMALERINLSKKQREATVEAEKEKMRSNLLRAISHDLRTPLTGILGASSAIIENGLVLDTAEHDKLILSIKDDSQWLIRMVENLLSVTKINDGNTKVIKTHEAAEEIVAEAVSRTKIRYPNKKITVTVPDDFLLVPMDATLIEQVLINLIENAIKYSGEDSKVFAKIFVEDDYAVFEVSDTGIGIPPESLPTIFDGFRVTDNQPVDSSRGMGIGLTICKSIIKAHSGKIFASNREDGGAVFTFKLPLKE